MESKAISKTSACHGLPWQRPMQGLGNKSLGHTHETQAFSEVLAAPLAANRAGLNQPKSAYGTYETSGLSGIGSAFKVKPDIGPPFAEVRV
jgi:hypothetical protein